MSNGSSLRPKRFSIIFATSATSADEMNLINISSISASLTSICPSKARFIAVGLAG